MPLKYNGWLLIVVGVIVLPPFVARAVGAPIGMLASMAAFQLFGLLAFFVTALASLALGVHALVKREWKKAGWFGLAFLIPFAAWGLAALTNQPGWEAVMGI